jgi:hypothetical protein
MKYSTVVFFLFFVFSLPSSKAQQNHFIYIQHETNQSFYVKLDNKTYNSTAAGYVILPKLKDGTYKLSIGFPRNSIIEQNMVCTIDKADIGFILKNFENKGWGLFNLQTLDVVMDNGAVNSNNISVVNKTDAFSNMLSEVVNDSTIRQADPMINENNKVTIKEQEKKSTDLIVEQEPVIQKSKVEMINNTSAAVLETRDSLQGINAKQVVSNNTKSSISRSLIKKEAEGTRMVFVDRIKGAADTVNVFIPEDKLPVAMIEAKPIETKVPVQEINPIVSIKEDKVGKARFIDIELPVSGGVNSDKKPVENVISESKESSSMNIKRGPADLPALQANQTLMVNSDCTVLASEEDLMKLRKIIKGPESDDCQLQFSKIYLKYLCYMVDQIIDFCVLFSKDDARFSYFEIAFPFVFDSNNFMKLQNQLKDPNYINRFHLMIRH